MADITGGGLLPGAYLIAVPTFSLPGGPINRQHQAYLFGLGAVLCWSTVATAFKLSLAHLSPAQLGEPILPSTLVGLGLILGGLAMQQ